VHRAAPGPLLSPAVVVDAHGLPLGAHAGLRGATVDVDASRIRRVVTVACLVGLAGIVGVLFAAGASKNAQINELRDHGVAVTVTVASCRGLLAGSGSNPAGYACTGSYQVNGRTYVASVPGDSLYAAGATVREVAAGTDPGLLASAPAVAAERASWRVFVVPMALLGALLTLVGVTVRRRRRGARGIAEG